MIDWWDRNRHRLWVLLLFSLAVEAAITDRPYLGLAIAGCAVYFASTKDYAE